MKSLIIMALLVVTGMTKAQTNYEKGMAKGFQLWEADQWEDELEPYIFYRISRKFYVNINAIKDIISYTNSRLQIKLNYYNEQDVIVARERVKDFKNWLE